LEKTNSSSRIGIKCPCHTEEIPLFSAGKFPVLAVVYNPRRQGYNYSGDKEPETQPADREKPCGICALDAFTDSTGRQQVDSR